MYVLNKFLPFLRKHFAQECVCQIVIPENQCFCFKSLVLQMPCMLSPEKVPASLALHSIKNWRNCPTLSFPTIVRLVY